MVYNIHSMSEKLIWISWERTPTSQEAGDFLNQLKKLLDDADGLIYFISDLRRGRIIDMRVIQQLGALSAHPNWGGSSAFTESPISKLFVGNFQRMVVKDAGKNSMFDQPEQALAFLEALEPGLTENIAWNEMILPDRSATS